ncbi:transcription antitermination factor NusB [Hyphobacterium sp. HN65]|uniref:Transcription antitermination protein NusB n=1 Tax=Hyphobacterium lacteum TaxID=3116575 RepID=A0ABU7LM62_9PROT|nr:transcription antitermination factor NusB [Hyphobacterium sp. HN65]MEE2525020.1 transcription antitermination factor NusB [Hyphobacterium sp. HN65]
MEPAEDIMPEMKPKPAARLAAVQAVFQAEQDDAGIDRIVAQFLEHRMQPTADKRLFENIVRGVVGTVPVIDQQIRPALSDKWTVQRLDPTLRAILRCGVYELTAHSDLAIGTILQNYVDLAGAFFSDKETAFANAVLDRIARDLRPQEGNA